MIADGANNVCLRTNNFELPCAFRDRCSGRPLVLLRNVIQINFGKVEGSILC
jgi:hypothetical protein